MEPPLCDIIYSNIISKYYLFQYHLRKYQYPICIATVQLIKTSNGVCVLCTHENWLMPTMIPDGQVMAKKLVENLNVRSRKEKFPKDKKLLWSIVAWAPAGPKISKHLFLVLEASRAPILAQKWAIWSLNTYSELALQEGHRNMRNIIMILSLLQGRHFTVSLSPCDSFFQNSLSPCYISAWPMLLWWLKSVSIQVVSY